MTSKGMFVIFAIVFVVVIFGAMSQMNNQVVDEQVANENMTYSSVDELNQRASVRMVDPKGATDIRYSSTADGSGKYTVRMDFNLGGYSCYMIEKSTLMFEDISGINKSWEHEAKVKVANAEWTLKYDNTEGIALYYDGANGWMMKCLHEVPASAQSGSANVVSEQSLVQLIESVS